MKYMPISINILLIIYASCLRLCIYFIWDVNKIVNVYDWSSFTVKFIWYVLGIMVASGISGMLLYKHKIIMLTTIASSVIGIIMWVLWYDTFLVN